MIYFFMGHRGTGKSTLAKKLNTGSFYDLDEDITQQEGRSIQEIFSKEGEEHFRSLEFKTLHQLLSSYRLRQLKDTNANDTIIVLGAGFRLKEFPFDEYSQVRMQFVFIKRDTDSLGRIFLDRPRINLSQENDLDEYFDCFNQRDLVFKEFSDVAFKIPEGIADDHPFIEQFLSGFFSSASVSQYKNSIPNVFIPLSNRSVTLTKKLLDLHFSIELRSDHFSFDQILMILNSLPDQQLQQVMVSFRGDQPLPYQELLKPQFQKIWVDVDVKGDSKSKGVTHEQLGAFLNYFQNASLSSHPSDSGSIQNTWVNFAQQTSTLKKQCSLKDHIYFKFSPELADYASWVWLEDQIKETHKTLPIVFFPRRKTNANPEANETTLDFSGLRILNKFNQPFQFVQLCDEVNPDCPTLAQWLSYQRESKLFYAVLGDPVQHSYSPCTHAHYLKYSMPCISLVTSKKDYEFLLPHLLKRGLAYASLTSPLKREKGENTLIALKSKSEQRDHIEVNYYNTDQVALLEILKKAQEPIMVWGGGGILPSLYVTLEQLNKKADYYSVRTGSLRDFEESEQNSSTPKNPQSKKHYRTLIYAAAPKTQAVPPKSISFDQVIDLSYHDYSWSRALGKDSQSYMSGLEMFYIQAKAQYNLFQRYGYLSNGSK